VKTIIYFVRHGAVENPKNRVYGRLPGFPLSKIGREQAKKLAEYFSSHKIAAVFSSPLTRARQTAIPIAKSLHLPLNISKMIIETDVAGWHGMTLAERERTFEFKIYKESPTQFLVGNETLEQTGKRVARFCQIICRKFGGREIIAVSHEDSIRLGRLYLLKKSIDLLHHLQISKGEFVKFEFDQSSKLVKTSKPFTP